MARQSREDRLQHESAARMFEIQASKLFLSISQRLANYRYIVLDETRGAELTCMVLAHSFDFYERRVYRGKHKIDLLIVQHHNAVVPIRVLALDTSAEYDPGVAPKLERPGAKRPNRDEVELLVSKLLLGIESGHEQLQRMPRRTQQRYLQRRDKYLLPRVGHPWAS